MKKNTYRNLTINEITLLQKNKCSCDNWDNVYVSGIFLPSRFFNVRFTDKIIIGEQTKQVTFPGGVKKECGIYYSHLHNCSIGKNVYISHVENHIANYIIEDDVIIEHIDICSVNDKSTFGNGIRVKVLDETGKRNVLIYDNLSSQLAYILAFYRHIPSTINNIESLIENYIKDNSSSQGIIGHHSHITNCKKIINVKIGPYTTIDGTSVIENGSLNSNEYAPINIGPEVILRNFIVSSGTIISDGSLVTNCFVGQGCIISSQYSADNSLFFANCCGYHGEACSLFAGPYTVTHHKSTLLIAGMFSFCNAGSGSNQSNHMYKLGPIHQGILERGAKTASDSYILWPAKIGAFTLVMGRHYKNSDTSDIPFSYMIEHDDNSMLFPAANLKSIGTIRDATKWPKRDKRKDPHLMDCVNPNLLSPYTIQKMYKAIKTLKNLQKNSGETTDLYTYNGTIIKRSSLIKGIEIYNLAIMKFIGNSVISRINQCDTSSIEKFTEGLKPINKKGLGEWVDISGLIAPKEEINRLLKSIDNNQTTALSQIEETFYKIQKDYYENEWTWTYNFIISYLKKSIIEFSIEEIEKLIVEWCNSVIKIDKMLYIDAQKEFRLNSMTGFGIDGDKKIKKSDFEQVRGKFEENDFVKEIQQHIKKKTNLKNRVLKQLNNLKKQKQS